MHVFDGKNWIPLFSFPYFQVLPHWGSIQKMWTGILHCVLCQKTKIHTYDKKNFVLSQSHDFDLESEKKLLTRSQKKPNCSSGCIQLRKFCRLIWSWIHYCQQNPQQAWTWVHCQLVVLNVRKTRKKRSYCWDGAELENIATSRPVRQKDWETTNEKPTQSADAAWRTSDTRPVCCG